MKTLKSFLKDESGATAIEYGLIAALISIVCILAMRTVGGNLRDNFNNVATNLTV